MLEQLPRPEHVVVDPVPGRARAWRARFIPGPLAPGSMVVVRNYIADLAPDEDVVDYPDTHEMGWDEWVARHEEYGLAEDGSPLELKETV